MFNFNAQMFFLGTLLNGVALLRECNCGNEVGELNDGCIPYGKCAVAILIILKIGGFIKKIR